MLQGRDAAAAAPEQADGISRSVALANSRRLLEKDEEALALVGERPEGENVVRGDLMLQALGVIETAPGYHDSRHIWPVGYRCVKVGIREPAGTAAALTCSILRGAGGPLFQIKVEAEEAGDKPRVVDADSEAAVWQKALQVLGVAGLGREREAVLGGPSFFNATVERLIEGLDGARDARGYQCVEQRGGGHEVIARRVRRAADHAPPSIADLRDKLEQQWRKNLSPEDKERKGAARKEVDTEARRAAKAAAKARKDADREEAKAARAAEKAAARKAKAAARKAEKVDRQDAKDAATAAGGGKRDAAQRRPTKKEKSVAEALLSQVRKEVENQLRARRKEARAAVLSRFDADQAAARAGPGWEEGISGDGDAVAEPPPAPLHNEPHPGAIPGARLEHVMELWNFLQTFKDPLGLRETPSLQQLQAALMTVSAPEQGAADGAAAAAAAAQDSAAAAAATAAADAEAQKGQGDGEAELTFASAPVADALEARKEAAALLDAICSSMVRLLVPELHAALGHPCDHLPGEGKDGEGGVGFEDVLVVNALTWPELMRQALMLRLGTEYLQVPPESVRSWVTGGERHWKADRATMVLLRQRVERRWNRGSTCEAAPPRAAKSEAMDVSDDGAAAAAAAALNGGGDAPQLCKAEEAAADDGGEGRGEKRPLEGGAVERERATPEGNARKRFRNSIANVLNAGGACGAESAGVPDAGGALSQGGESAAASAPQAVIAPELVKEEAAVLKADAAANHDMPDVARADVAQAASAVAAAADAAAQAALAAAAGTAGLAPAAEAAEAAAPAQSISDVDMGLDGEGEEGDEESEEEEEMEGEARVRRDLQRFLEDASHGETARRCGAVLLELMRHQSGYFFILDPDQWSMPEYDEVISRPVSMSTILARLQSGAYTAAAAAAASGSSSGDAAAAAHDAALTAAFADDMRLMFENCWCYNHEGSQPWAAAEALSVVFERLLREWALDAARPQLAALLGPAGRPCSACREASAAAPIVLCDRCDAVYHLGCLVPPLLEAPRNEWFCPVCVAGTATAPTVGAGYGCAARLGRTPPFLSGSAPRAAAAAAGSSSAAAAAAAAGTFPGPWGVSGGVPSALDWSLNARMWHTLDSEGEGRVLHDALRLLGRRSGGALPGGAASWTAAERVVVLLALASLTLATPALHQYLSEGEQRCRTLRQKALSGAPISDAAFQNGLRSVGGPNAVAHWKALLAETGGEALLAAAGSGDADDDAELLGPTPGVCTVCWFGTFDCDDGTVLICDGCNGEVHVRCSKLRAVPPEGEPFYCRGCQRRREAKARAVKARGGGGAGAAAAAAAAESAMAFEEPALLLQDRLERESALKQAVIQRVLEERQRLHQAALAAAATADGDAGGGGGGAKRSRCGTCTGCAARACGKCAACKAAQAEGGSAAATTRRMREACVKRRCQALSEAPLDWDEVLASAGGGGSGGGGACEYCGGSELALCSTLVRGQTRAEMEAHVAMQRSLAARRDGRMVPLRLVSDGRVLPPPPLLLPYLPPLDSQDAEALDACGRSGGGGGAGAHGPCVHEVCAQAMVKALAEQARHGLRQLRERAVEEAVRLSGFRTDPLGADRAGRLYLRFAADPHRLYVCTPGDTDAAGGGGGGGGAAAAVAAMLRRRGGASAEPLSHSVPCEGKLPPDWVAYSHVDDLRRLVAWLNPHTAREGPLREALLKAYPVVSAPAQSAEPVAEEPHSAEQAAGAPDGAQAAADHAPAADGGDADGSSADEASNGSSMDVSGPEDEQNNDFSGSDSSAVRRRRRRERQRRRDSGGSGGARSGGGGSARGSSSDEDRDEDRDDHRDANSDAGSGDGGGGDGGGSGGDDDGAQRGEESARRQQQRADEGKFPPPGGADVALALCDVTESERPPEEATVAFEDDEHGGEVTKDGAVQFHGRRYYAVAIVAADRGGGGGGGDAAAAAAPGGGAGVGGTPLRLPKTLTAKVTYDIWRDGQLVAQDALDRPFSRADPRYYFRAAKFKRTGTYTMRFAIVVDQGAAAEEGYQLLSRAPPLSFTVRVTAKFARTGAAAALNRLRAAKVQQNQPRRRMGAELCLAAELDPPLGCDELSALRNALAAVMNALPRGALRETEESPAQAAAAAAGAGTAEPVGAWTPALRDSWLDHVTCAGSCAALAEAALLMEACLDPKWLRPWYRPALACLPHAAQLLRLATPGALAQRLFLLDRALLYDRVGIAGGRGAAAAAAAATRSMSYSGGGYSSIGASVAAARPRRAASARNGGGGGGAAPAPKGRQTRTSRAAAARTDRAARRGRRGGYDDDDDDLGGWDQASSDGDWRGGSNVRTSRRTRDRARPSYRDPDDEEEGDAAPAQRASRAQRRKRGGGGGSGRGESSEEASVDEDGGGSDDSTGDGWRCSQCTVLNSWDDKRCATCNALRPAAAKPRSFGSGSVAAPAPHKRQRRGSSGGGGGSSHRRRSYDATSSSGGGGASDSSAVSDGGGGARQRASGSRGRQGSSAQEDEATLDDEGPLVDPEVFGAEPEGELAALGAEDARWRRGARAALLAAAHADFAEPFLYPVSVVQWPDYPSAVSRPMDLSTMSANLRHGGYDGHAHPLFLRDAEQIRTNCEKFNGKRMKISASARKLAAMLRRLVRRWCDGRAPGGGGDSDTDAAAPPPLGDDACAACGLGEDAGELARCEGCHAPHHAFCIDEEPGARRLQCPECAEDTL